MVRTRRGTRTNFQASRDENVDPIQRIMHRLDEQQRTMQQIQDAQARQQEDRDAVITAAVAAAVAQLRQPEQVRTEAVPQVQTEAIPQVQPQRVEELARPAGNLNDVQQWIAKFCKHNPPEFRGTMEPQIAEEWITRLEKIFRVMGCSSEVKAQMAIYKLETEADQWWNNVEMVLQAENIPVTWELFKERFYQKFFPRSVQDRMEAEFLVLQQGEQETFDDYLAKHIRLSRYSTYLKRMNDERWNTEKLVRGLKPSLREVVAPQQLENFNKAVEVCRITETSQNHRGSIQKVSTSERPQPRPNQGGNSYGNKKRKWSGSNKKAGRDAKQVERFDITQRTKECDKCGRDHGDRPCLYGQNVCFRCGKPGHYMSKCPQGAEGTRPLTQGRVFALTQEEAHKSPDRIQGTVAS